MMGNQQAVLDEMTDEFELQIWDGEKYEVEDSGDDPEMRMKPSWLSPTVWCSVFAPRASTRSWRRVRTSKLRDDKPKYRRPRKKAERGFLVELQAEAYVDWLIATRGKDDLCDIPMWSCGKTGYALEAQQCMNAELNRRKIKRWGFKILPRNHNEVVEEHDDG